jgi:hypothetical protein
MPVGDDIHENHEGEKFLFHNINGIKDDDNWHQIMTTMKELQVDIFGFAELNKTMNHGKKLNWTHIMRKYFYYSRSAHSESNIKMNSYKPGGTMTMVTGKWQSQITEYGQDPRGLGRWSYIKISTNKKLIIIAMAYRPCATQGPSTSWMQQWVLLRQEGIPDPDPIKKIYKDIETTLTGWRTDKHEIILLMDANEQIGQSPGGMKLVMGKVGMSNLLRHRHPNITSVHTYARGSQQIDYIYGTENIREHCTRAGVIPFGTRYHSDHGAILCSSDFHTQVSAVTIYFHKHSGDDITFPLHSIGGLLYSEPLFFPTNIQHAEPSPPKLWDRIPNITNPITSPSYIRQVTQHHDAQQQYHCSPDQVPKNEDSSDQAGTPPHHTHPPKPHTNGKHHKNDLQPD